MFRLLSTIAFLSVSFCVALPLVGQEVSPSTPLSAAALLQDELKLAVATEALLHGAWVDVISANNNVVRLEVIVDSDRLRGPAQEALIRKLASRRLGGDAYVVQVTQLPFSELLQEIQEAVEFDPVYDSAVVDDAYYLHGPENSIALNLVGRAASSEQRAAVMLAASELLDQQFGPRTARVRLVSSDGPVVEPAGIVIVAPSERVAEHCYDQGVKAYIVRDFPRAYFHFTRAHVESPIRKDIQYWRAASLIGSDREQHALLILAPLARSSVRPAGLLYRLERIQGPIRQRLVALEDYLVTHPEVAVEVVHPVSVAQKP